MTWQMQGLQNTCAQCVITGNVNESRQIEHSSSEPELRINFIFVTSIFLSSSGVSLPTKIDAQKLVSDQNLYVTRIVYLI